MRKKIISCLIICVVIVLSYFYAHIDKNSYIYNRNSDTALFYGTGILLNSEEITQTFIAEENVIDGFNIKIATAGNVDKVVLSYSVIDEMSEVIAQAKVPANALESNKFNRLEIPTIENTEGKQYTLVLSTENADEQNGVGFYIEPGRRENQQLTIKNNDTDGTLVARIISHRFDMETFVVLLGIILFVVMFMKVLYKFFK